MHSHAERGNDHTHHFCLKAARPQASFRNVIGHEFVFFIVSHLECPALAIDAGGVCAAFHRAFQRVVPGDPAVADCCRGVFDPDSLGSASLLGLVAKFLQLTTAPSKGAA